MFQQPMHTPLSLLRRALAIALATLLVHPVAGAVTGKDPLLVRHSFFINQDSDQLNYKGEVLTLLLEKSKPRFGPYVMQRDAQKGWNQNRQFSELERGNLDLLASMTNEAREQSGIPVRVCLYKGLLGVRIGMGTRANVRDLDRVKTREELNRVRIGQVFDWPDYAIQNDAGLQVLRLSDLDSSLKRLKMGTFQLLPLGIVEVGPIAKQHDLATISTWALAYPTAYYFFVSRTRPELAERLAYGFEVALKDGSFNALFDERIGAQVKAARLDQRILFRIPNPYLPKATPLARRELWHPLTLIP